TDASTGTELEAVQSPAAVAVAEQPRESEHVEELTVVRPEEPRKIRVLPPLLLVGAACVVAFAIVFSSTTAAGSRWPVFVLADPSRAVAYARFADVAAPYGRSVPVVPPEVADSPLPTTQPQVAPDRCSARSTADSSRTRTHSSTRSPSSSPTP